MTKEERDAKIRAALGSVFESHSFGVYCKQCSLKVCQTLSKHIGPVEEGKVGCFYEKTYNAIGKLIDEAEEARAELAEANAKLDAIAEVAVMVCGRDQSVASQIGPGWVSDGIATMRKLLLRLGYTIEDMER